jgi:hypothetical protein
MWLGVEGRSDHVSTRCRKRGRIADEPDDRLPVACLLLEPSEMEDERTSESTTCKAPIKL